MAIYESQMKRLCFIFLNIYTIHIHLTVSIIIQGIVSLLYVTLSCRKLIKVMLFLYNIICFLYSLPLSLLE